MALVVVMLQSARYPAGPARVIGRVLNVEEYRRRYADKDGTIPATLRVWQDPTGELTLGQLVRMGQILDLSAWWTRIQREHRQRHGELDSTDKGTESLTNGELDK